MHDMKTRRPTVSSIRILLNSAFVGTDARFVISSMPGGNVRINTRDERTVDHLLALLDEMGYRFRCSGVLSVIVSA